MQPNSYDVEGKKPLHLLGKFASELACTRHPTAGTVRLPEISQTIATFDRRASRARLTQEEGILRIAKQPVAVRDPAKEILTHVASAN